MSAVIITLGQRPCLIIDARMPAEWGKEFRRRFAVGPFSDNEDMFEWFERFADILVAEHSQYVVAEEIGLQEINPRHLSDGIEEVINPRTYSGLPHVFHADLPVILSTRARVVAISLLKRA